MSGLTAAGFVPKRLDEIRDDLESAVKAVFGNNVQLGPESVMGAIIGIMAERFSDLHELTERVYAAGYVAGATGNSLDDLAALLAITRPGATHSTVTLTLTGTPATVVPAGSTAKDAQGVEWITATLATIGGGGTITVDASPSETGPIAALAGTLTIIGTPVAGWASVTNAADAVVGRFAYSDAALRNYIRLAMRSGGGSSADGLLALLLRLDGVTEVGIIQNDSDYVDADGRPAHSFEAIVRDGDAQEIADEIWFSKPNGVATYGDTTTVVVDAAGDNQDVNWSRPVEVNVYVEIDYTPGDGFPTDGADLILAAVLDYGSSFVLGQDVIAFQIVQRIEVEGIDDLQIRIGKLASPATDEPIAISRKELAIFDSSRVVITEV